MTKKVGLEKEFIIVDRQGAIQNKADEIIGHERNTGFIVKESSKGVVEVNSDPASSLRSLEASLRKQLLTLDRISCAYDLLALPLSVIGPGDHFEPRQDEERNHTQTLILGQQKTYVYYYLCGTHLHIDKESNVPMQYNLLQSLDPLFILLSATPYIRGRFSSYAGRVSSQRFNVFKDKQGYGGLLGYISNLEDIERESLIQHANLVKDLREKGIPGELSNSIYTTDNSCWGPLRIREHTLELRGPDSNVLSLVMAFTAAVKGINDFVFNHGLEVLVCQQNENYNINHSEICVPHYADLKRLEGEAMHSGLRSERVNKYLSYLLQIAHAGLSEEDRQYLKPFNEMLTNKRTLADVVQLMARNTSTHHNLQHICEYSARQINLFMYDTYISDLQDSQATLDLIQFGEDLLAAGGYNEVVKEAS